MDLVAIRAIINAAPNGYVSAETVRELLEAAGIGLVQQQVVTSADRVPQAVEKLQFPLAMKVVGPVHKTEVGGVALNVSSTGDAQEVFARLMQITDAKGVLIQEMASGEELYCGAVKEGDFGHVVLCGLGGIFLELIGDTASGLAPLSRQEAEMMIESLKGYELFKGYRNLKPLNKDKFVDVVMRIGALVHVVVV